MFLPFLSRLDTVVTEALEIPNSHRFPWLPVVYGDQDDLWIKVLMILLDMLSR